MYCTFQKHCKVCNSWKYDNKQLKFLGYQQDGLLLFNCKCENTVAVPITNITFLDEFFTLNETAENLGITRQGVNYLINQEEITPVEINGKKKIHYKELARFMGTRKGIKDERYKFRL